MKIEPLESRIAPATLVNPKTLAYTDIDGDRVTVTASAGAFVFANPPSGTMNVDTFVFTAPNGIGGQQLQLVDLRQGSGFQGADLTVSVVKAGAGDGLAAVGLILATGIDLGKVTVKGDLGEIDAGDLDTATPGIEALSVRSLGRYGEATDPLVLGLKSDIKGALGALRVAEDIRDASIVVTADVDANATIGSITIGGALIGGSVAGSGQIFAEGNVGTVQIGRDLIGGDGIGSGALVSKGTLGNVTIGGSVVGGSGDDSAQLGGNGGLGAVKISGNVIGGSGVRSGGIFTDGPGAKIGPVTIGGSLLGRSGANSGSIFTQGDLGAVTIAHDLQGGAGNDSGKILTNGKLASLTIGGALVGGSGDYGVAGDRHQIFAAGGIGFIQVGHDVQGGVGDGSARVGGAGPLGAISIGGSLLGGAGLTSGRFDSEMSIGAVKIGHDLVGGSGETSGILKAGGGLASVSIGGSLIGGSGLTGNAQILSDGPMGAVTIRGDLLGGPAPQSGVIRSGDRLASVLIGGSLVGSIAGGAITSTKDLGSVRIGHDFIGASLEAGAIKSVAQSGFIGSGGRIGTVTIGGSIIAGVDASATAGIFDSATIRAAEDIGSLTVKGGLIGNAGPLGESLVVISAQGQATPGAKSDLAIGKISIGGRVEFARILAGYDTSLVAKNADAQIGAVSVAADWVASSLVAGAINLGLDDAPGGAGDDADNQRFGDLHDTKIIEVGESAAIVSRIGGIKIGGQVFGTPGSFSTADRFGFVAEQIGALKIGGATFALDPAPRADAFFVGSTGDATLSEVGPLFAVAPLPTGSAKLINATTVTYEDVDGDRVTVKLSKPLLTAGNVNTVFTFDTGLVDDGVNARQQLQLLDLRSLAAAGVSVSVSVAPGGGDRLANVGAILADEDLGTITLPGDLGQIGAGDANAATTGLAALKVRTLGRLGLDTQPLAVAGFNPFLGGDILGSLGALSVKQDVTSSSLAIGGSLGSLIIGGSLIGGSAPASGAISTAQGIGAVKIGHHVQTGAGAGSGFIDAGTSIASLTVGGSVIGGVINADGTTLGAVKIGHNVIGGTTGFSGRISANTGVGNVSVVGSLLGGRGDSSGQIFSAAGGIGAVKIDRNLAGGAGNESGKIDSAGKLAGVTVRGSLVGGEGDYNTFSPGGIDHRAQIFAVGDIGPVKIAHDVTGGAGVASGGIRTGGNLAGLTVGGSLLGGTESDTARIVVMGSIGSVKIGHDILGGTGQNAAAINPTALASATVGGSIVGGTRIGSGQINGPVSIGAVKVGHDVLGGAGITSGYIVSDGKIASVTIGGSLVGGTANLTGGIFPTELGPVKIGGDLVGGSIAGTAATLDRTGFIESSSRIASVSIRGSIIAGIDDSTAGSLTRSGSIRAGADLGSLSVKGSLVGNVALDGSSLVIISARGQAAPVGGKDVAIGKITIGGRVERANIFAGYATDLVASNDGVQIGKVSVGHDWIASNLVAGVQNLGADGLPGGTGADADNVNFGDSFDAPIGAAGIANRIASILIRGAVVGTDTTGDHFGFSAGEIGSFKSLNFTAPLSLRSDVIDLSPITDDVKIRET
ncbi:MAG: hypothetical protein WCF18_20705 [Chthoniobacteraceae bacterium]